MSILKYNIKLETYVHIQDIVKNISCNQKNTNRKEVRLTLNNIEAERVRNQIPQEDLAKQLGVTWKTYYNWVHEKTDITGAALLKLKEIFHKDIDYLMEGSIHAGKSTA